MQQDVSQMAQDEQVPGVGPDGAGGEEFGDAAGQLRPPRLQMTVYQRPGRAPDPDLCVTGSEVTVPGPVEVGCLDDHGIPVAEHRPGGPG
ncbi:hypothetical protein ACGFY9_15925 [Streptomyces sp. NPDC048504]|uniref:hypothetical protein n=1 Tax=Streptomyces sp. NPDC048504 TaxID=3365559 RepID=UPI0037215324